MKRLIRLCCLTSPESDSRTVSISSSVSKAPTIEEDTERTYRTVLEMKVETRTKDKEHQRGGSMFETECAGECQCVEELSSGRHTFTYKSGAVYDGEWLNYQRSGRGKMRFLNNIIYSGEWLRDLPSGHGVLELSPGLRYTGNWQRAGYTGSVCLLETQPPSFPAWLAAVNDGYGTS